jgi:hypothetical protein
MKPQCRSDGAKSRAETTPKELFSRNRLVAALHEIGVPLKDITARFRLSKSAVSHILRCY